MNGFRKIFPTFLSHYATFFVKMAERKVVAFDEFYYQLNYCTYFCYTLYFLFISHERSFKFISCPEMTLT
jgi:hypothetical protein